MNTPNIATKPSTGLSSRPEFWEFLWRSAGVQSVGLFVVADYLRGWPPHVGATPDALLAFYQGSHVRILIAAALTGLAVLNLLWFAASVRITLADAGKDGWGAAATASSAAFGGMSLLVTALGAALAYSPASAANQAMASGLNDLSWSLLVLLSFPRAMLVMSFAFGLWRTRLISNAFFTLGVAFVVLGVLGGTTWVSGGNWAPDGAFARCVSPNLLYVWVVLVSWVLFTRRPAARTGW